MCLVKYGLFQLFSFLSKKLTGLYPVGLRGTNRNFVANLWHGVFSQAAYPARLILVV